MRKQIFIFLLAIISILGIILRLNHYASIPPFGETKDEFLYPWAGISLIQNGTPTSWSNFGAYPKGINVTYWGEQFRLVSPWLEKPPLYSVIVGAFALLNGQTTFADVRLTTIRLIPVFMSGLTIIGVGLLAGSLLDLPTGIIAALLYATIPMIVLGNRLGVIENFFVPISLLTLWVAIKHENDLKNVKSILILIGCAVVVLSKQIGIVLPITLGFISLLKKDWKMLTLLTLTGVIVSLINPLMGYLSDWHLYQAVMHEFEGDHTLGLPETMATLFRFPGIGHKESIFLDGSILAGFILFFASPLWIAHVPKKTKLYLLAFPFFYISLLTLLEGGTTWYGWHLFPLFPFLVILLAYALISIWRNYDLFLGLFTVLFLGGSSLRFFLLTYNQLTMQWQPILAVIFILIAGLMFVPQKVQKNVLSILFVVFIGINVLTIVNLYRFYPEKVQPISLVAK